MNDAVQDGKDRKPSPWAQVADAGFSAVLERRGFERIGKTLWRLQGDRVVWHYGLYRGVGAIPGSFRDNGGVLVPEHDAFFRREFGRGSAYKLDGLQQFAHMPFDMHHYWYRRERERQARTIRPPSGPFGRLLAWAGHGPKPPPLVHPPFSSNATDAWTEPCWMTVGFDVAEVASALGQVWDDCIWPEVEDMSSISGVRKRIWSREDRRDFIGNILAAALDNDRDEVMASVARLRERAERPVEHFLEDGRSDGTFRRRGIPPGDKREFEVSIALKEESARLFAVAVVAAKLIV